jgi:hypothetical protein
VIEVHVRGTGTVQTNRTLGSLSLMPLGGEGNNIRAVLALTSSLVLCTLGSTRRAGLIACIIVLHWS